MIELSFFLLILIIGFVCFILGAFYRISPFFYLGVALIIGSGILLWGTGGLVLGRSVASVSDLGVVSYTNISVDIVTDLGLQALSLVLVACGILSVFVFDFSVSSSRRKSAFHY